MLTTRPAKPNDFPRIKRIDLSTYPYPWGEDDWLYKMNFVSVATSWGAVVGFIVWRVDQTNLSTRIHRLGVLKDHRRKGAGSALIGDCIRTCSTKKIDILVPEYQVCPGGEEDASLFLKSLGFVAKTPFQKGAFFEYGRKYDGVLFELKLRNA
jgi:GNAT superfamily N-acetyltransferase